MPTRYILWIIAAVSFVITILDIADGKIPKLISSSSITIAFLLMAAGQNKPNQKMFYQAALVFVLIAISVFAYNYFY